MNRNVKGKTWSDFDQSPKKKEEDTKFTVPMDKLSSVKNARA